MKAAVERIKVGVSSCLLGQKVRYDGDDKYSEVIARTLAETFELVPFCPEVEIGLGVPREPIKLIESSSGLRCIGTLSDDLDVTDKLAGYADQQRPLHRGLCGYIFKARSPSCGLQGVPVWLGQRSQPTGIGIYSARLRRNFIDMPMIEEEPLTHPALRQQFIRQVLDYHHRQKASATR